LGGANEEVFTEIMTRIIAAPTFKNMSETISAIKRKQRGQALHPTFDR
jgi:hypothetical protein